MALYHSQTQGNVIKENIFLENDNDKGLNFDRRILPVIRAVLMLHPPSLYYMYIVT